MMNSEKLELKAILSYAVLAIPLAMLGLPLYIYLPTFYAQYTGMSIALVGTILFFSRVMDVISDPLIGIYNDRFKSRFGKRKPFMFAGSLLLVGGFYALIHPPLQQTSLWLFVFSVLVYIGWSMISIPYLAWSAEITTDYHEKMRLSATREFFGIIGALSALLIPYLYSISQDTQASLSLLCIVCIISIAILLPITFFGTKEVYTQSTQRIVLKQIVALWKKNPSLYTLQSAFTINSLANALPATLFLFYVELVLEEPSKTGLFLILYFVSGIIGLPFWSILAKQIGKVKSWQSSMMLASLAFAFVPFLDSGDFVLFAIITFVSGLSLGADMALPASIQTDVVQKIQTQKSSYAGVLFGIWAMLTKFSFAFAVGLGFIVLGAVDFDAKAPSALALTTLSLLYGGMPVLLKVLSFWIMKGYRDIA